MNSRKCELVLKIPSIREPQKRIGKNGTFRKQITKFSKNWRSLKGWHRSNSKSSVTIFTEPDPETNSGLLPLQ